MAATGHHDNDGILSGIDRVVGGGVMVLVSTAVAGAGAMMWAFGSIAPEAPKPPRASRKPSIAVGLGTASMTWSF
ncbi:hypothetical protein A7982_13213 [Minicystis rosea]|nr:hypothetical protein A7982_13213 [Minicystis rosea]